VEVASNWEEVLTRLDDNRWQIPPDYKEGMRVPGIVYADDNMIKHIIEDQALDQVANVAFLPGIVYASLGMPDIHWGYGFPVGGVAATRVDGGVVSPGGVGFDINCGVRFLRTGLTEEEVRPQIEKLVQTLYRNIPTGVGSKGKVPVGRDGELDEVMTRGALWAVENGFGVPDDAISSEEGGVISGANPETVSQKARKRGLSQLGTLGSGNHFLEVEVVDEIFDPWAAGLMGIDAVGQITVLMHCGSRGLGHQVCTDYIKVVEAAGKEYEIFLPDRQLASVPVTSPEGESYLGAMRCAANFAWANRQCITHWTRESFQRVFDKSWEEMGINQVYDVAHNIAKIERHTIDGEDTELCIHRKGATRSFPPGSSDIPAKYREMGQPVMIPGDMGRYSFLAVGSGPAMEGSLGSTCHGAGRAESRSGARRLLEGRDIQQELREQGIIVKAHGGWKALAEEAPIAYKDVADVVDVCNNAGLCRKVARMRPLGVIKG
jgi:tRNA-splicing ligase RtcB